MSVAQANSPVAYIAVTDTAYGTLESAIIAAYSGGTVDVLKDVTVDTWYMNLYSQREESSAGNSSAPTGLTINGNNHSLTIKDFDNNSRNNGAYIFGNSNKDKMTKNFTINDWTINLPNEGSVNNGLRSQGFGVDTAEFNNVTFNGGRYAINAQNASDLVITNCKFNNQTSSAIYTDKGTKNTITNSTFNSNLSINGSNWTFTGNTVNGNFDIGTGYAGTFTKNDLTKASIGIYNGPDALNCIDLSANYWGDKEPNQNAFYINNGVHYQLISYYTDEAVTKLAVVVSDTMTVIDTSDTGAMTAAGAATKALFNSLTDDGTVVVPVENKTIVWTTEGGHGSSPLLLASSGTDELVIDGGTAGGTMVVNGAGVGQIRAANDGTIVFRNMTIVDQSVSYKEDSWEFGYLEFSGKLRFENCTFNSAISLERASGENAITDCEAVFTNCTFETEKESSTSVPTPSNMYVVWISDGKVTFTDCKIEGPYRGIKIHEAYGSNVDTVTITDCVFGPLSVKPGIAIGAVDSSTSISVTGCTFNDCQAGDQNLYKYESDTDVNTFNFTDSNNAVTNTEA